MFDDDKLLRKRDWMFRQIEKARKRRVYPALPKKDRDDLFWQGVGLAITCVLMFGLVWLLQALQGPWHRLLVTIGAVPGP